MIVGRSRIASAARARLLGMSRERLRGGNRRMRIAEIPGTVAGVGRERPLEPCDGFVILSRNINAKPIDR